MLYLLSPAKSLDYETPVPAAVAALATRPQFVADSQQLIDLLRELSVADVAELMDLSDALAELNVKRYKAWRPRFTAHNSRPAVLAFNGDVYEGLQASSLSLDQLHWAQQHLAILSGLYGVLRPLDLLQPYRLEMGTSLANPAGASLYAFWGDRIAEHLNKRAAAETVPVIINLASQEYFRAADRKALKPRVIDCQFEDWKGDRYKVISFFAKRARGLMARFAIEQRIDRPEGLKDFAVDGYHLAASESTPDRLLFRRRLED
ncbi:peroxide stress protein YaaA [Pelomonas sp. SE-A7]|uniref:peroxide stress protein YaaA n=1 Tax=Pelomonas sp. SE-A7 TaxID=3054953 RepID=UPI00259C9294|nr:peroxide stress protein YaaA [Pelomonas sp. SE-A7]MDM4764799.1 peroxide stress protein YaaA [Pelomonas sp. SE-A7]